MRRDETRRPELHEAKSTVTHHKHDCWKENLGKDGDGREWVAFSLSLITEAKLAAHHFFLPSRDIFFFLSPPLFETTPPSPPACSVSQR